MDGRKKQRKRERKRHGESERISAPKIHAASKSQGNKTNISRAMLSE